MGPKCLLIEHLFWIPRFTFPTQLWKPMPWNCPFGTRSKEVACGSFYFVMFPKRCCIDTPFIKHVNTKKGSLCSTMAPRKPITKQNRKPNVGVGKWPQQKIHPHICLRTSRVPNKIDAFAGGFDEKVSFLVLLKVRKNSCCFFIIFLVSKTYLRKAHNSKMRKLG